MKKMVKKNGRVASTESVLSHTKSHGNSKLQVCCSMFLISQLSLSRLCLSRITAYLEEKSGPCFNTEI